MTTAVSGDIAKVWAQSRIPVVERRNEKGERLRVKLPYRPDNREWLKDGRRGRPQWIPSEKCWLLPNAWFNDLVNRALDRFGSVYIIQPHREQEKCAPACWNAMGHVCQCSCLGANHGTGVNGGWFVVSETFATRWHELDVACRLLTKKAQ